MNSNKNLNNKKYQQVYIMYMLVGSQCQKNQLIWINDLKDMASRGLNSNLNKLKFKQCKNCETYVLQDSPGHYQYTGKRIDEFEVTDLKI